jgi:nitrogen regulatory protein P-II 1
MKKVEAVFRHQRLAIVRERLYELGLRGFHYHDVRGTGYSQGGVQYFEGTPYRNDPLPRVKLTVVVEDDEAEAVAQIIVKAAHSGNTGDGKVFLSPVDDVIRVRTGERGTGALKVSEVPGVDPA